MKNKAVDFLGNELEVGDKVAFVQIGYRQLMFGTISKVTAKTVMISHKETNVGTTKSKQFHEQVVKVYER